LHHVYVIPDLSIMYKTDMVEANMIPNHSMMSIR